jgi:hypothetical protein
MVKKQWRVTRTGKGTEREGSISERIIKMIGEVRTYLLFLGGKFILVFCAVVGPDRSKHQSTTHAGHKHSRGILVLLVFSHEILEVGLGFSELDTRTR